MATGNELFSGAVQSFQGSLGPVGVFAEIVAVAAVAFAVIFFVIQYFSYNIEINIYEKSGSGYRLVTTKGKFDWGDGGVGKIKLWRRTSTIEPPTSEHWYYRGAKRVLNLVRTDIDSYSPVTLQAMVDEVGNQILDERRTVIVKGLEVPNPNFGKPKFFQYQAGKNDISFWASQEMKRIAEQYTKKSMLDKLLPLLSTGVMLVAVVIMMIVMMKGMSDITNQQSNLMAQATTVLREARGYSADVHGSVSGGSSISGVPAG